MKAPLPRNAALDDAAAFRLNAGVVDPLVHGHVLLRPDGKALQDRSSHQDGTGEVDIAGGDVHVTADHQQGKDVQNIVPEYGLSHEPCRDDLHGAVPAFRHGDAAAVADAVDCNGDRSDGVAEDVDSVGSFFRGMDAGDDVSFMYRRGYPEVFPVDGGVVILRPLRSFHEDKELYFSRNGGLRGNAPGDERILP
jgi:hypothetical protein